MAGIKCCYKCEERYVGCHSNCKKYIGAKEQWEKDREIIKKQSENVGPTSKLAYDINFVLGKGHNKIKRIY